MEKLMNVMEMRVILAATVRGVRNRKVKPAEAKAIYGGTGQILATYKEEREYLKLAGRKPPENNAFLPPPDKVKGNGHAK